MASRETNNAKRNEMKSLMAVVLGEKGWSQKDLAIYMAVTGSCISSWKLGKSMGTNSQRAELAKLPFRCESAAREHIAGMVLNREQWVREAQNRFDTETQVEVRRAEVVRNRAFDIKHHTESLAKAEARKAANSANDSWYLVDRRNNGQTGYEWDVQYHNEKLAAALGLDIEKATAESVASSVRYYGNDVKKLQKELAKYQKALAAW